MVEKPYYIGLMSGTSVDALDAALVNFSEPTPAVISTCSVKIPEDIRDAVHRLAVPGDNEIQQLRYLDNKLALLSCQAVSQLCLQSGCDATSIRAIGSHGQTIRHYRGNDSTSGYSLQIGDPNIIAENTGITTVADFRRRDIAVGGDGAPLAPALHQVVFHSTTRDRIIINTGGIANITHLPRSGPVIGYDTGPANNLMDSWCQQHLKTPYDESGAWADSGTKNDVLLQHLLAHPFFAVPPPKSTGREDFNLPWLYQQLERLPCRIPNNDVQATLLMLTVESIAVQIERLDNNNSADIYLCGGGAHNKALRRQLSQRLHPRTVETTGVLGIHPDWVEAIAFAWQAKQTMDNATGNLPSVTGAQKKVILGGIYLSGVS